MERIYLDHAATSPLHPSVIEKMTATMHQQFGNPSSIHSFGREARHITDRAREMMAKSINAKSNEIIFTSGGTESDNLAILGTAEANKEKGKHVITTVIEHHAVLHAFHQLEKNGFEVTYLPVNENGLISISELTESIRPDTILVSVMFGNNEIGMIQPIHEIGELLKDHQALFHTDAVQAYGLEQIDVKIDHIDLLSVSAHKINGPKGIGFLYAKEGIKFVPRQFGGEQERKRRAGTENVASIAGFAEAVRLSQMERLEKRASYLSFKKLFVSLLKEADIEFSVNGLFDKSLPHVLNLSFPGTNVESMLVNLDLEGVAVSSGSACTAGSIDPSHVLVAMFGKDSDRLINSIRFSFGLYNTEEQIRKAAEITAKIVGRLRKS